MLQNFSVALLETLKAMCSSGVAPVRVLQRAQILLALDQGILDQQIAAVLQVERTRIWRVRQRYLDQQLKGALYDLLAGSFRPDDQICVLRSYIQQRDRLTKSASVPVQRMQKALTEMNLQLHRVVSDITGVTGMAIIRAIVAGEREKYRARLKDPRAKRSATEIAAALEGDYRHRP
jgi:hypothetical protein